MPISLPTPNSKSSLAEWQEAYNRYFTHYARMSPEFMKAGPLDYRMQSHGTQWAHQMVDASLGVWWQSSYVKTQPEKRDKFWRKLKNDSLFLNDETDALIAGSEPSEEGLLPSEGLTGPKEVPEKPQRTLDF